MAEALTLAYMPPVGTNHPIREIVLVPSGAGSFEVSVDGHLLYSKLSTGRHTTNEEVLGLLRNWLEHRHPQS